MQTRDLPDNPLSIGLTISHRRLWWQVDEGDHQPEQWNVSADVWLGPCYDHLRHAGDFSLVVADLHREHNLLDAIDLGEWALEFIAETVIDPAKGRLHPDLDEQISPGVSRMVVLRDWSLTPAWRGHSLGCTLLAGVLRAFAHTARLAVCRVSPLDFAEVAGPGVG